MKNKQQVRAQARKSVRTVRKLTPKDVSARKAIRSKRSIHKQIALQPVTVLLLICVGILLCVLTLRALADTVTTTAVVPAPPLTEPAVIVSPTDGLQTTTQALTVSGTCPSNSYVDLTDNAIFVGTAMCASGSFQISLDLTPGSNQLQAQDYNITNSPGPQSATVTVTYNPPMPPPTSNPSSGASPTATPVTLQVTQVDIGIPYNSSDQTPNVSQRPTLTGIAPPYSRISIVVTPGVHICTTYASGQGYWTCLMPAILQPGIYTVNVTALTPQGETLSVPSFKINATATVAPQVALPPLFHITSAYRYSKVAVGEPVSYAIQIIGGRAPYAFTIMWGDGRTSTIIRQSEDAFTISHTYGWVDSSFKSRVIKIQALDTTGQGSTLQLETLIRNPAYIASTTGHTKTNGLWAFFDEIRPWLWLIWPGYVIIILLVFSFWLGEREELAIIMRDKTRSTKRKPTPAHGHHP